MLVSYKWLNEYVDIKGVTPQELADRLSLTGIEVEGVEIPQEGLKKIVVGDVKECIPHPDSDHLSICQVDIGEEELSQIVCGAPNIKAGVKVIVALPGSRIGGNVKIKKGKMRGQVSNGMICSLQELGFSDSVIPKEYAEGIYYLPEDALAGKPVFPYLEMDDAIIDLSITPNRADALSIRGVAHEVAAIYNKKVDFPAVELKEAAEHASTKINVSVTDKTDAPHYEIRIIEDVKIGPSPQWLQNRLINEGIRPISNVVDVTNYILLLFGQPLHAFDYDKLGSKEIVVRRAKEKEPFTTLDGVERTLNPENIVITNGEIPVALAGVMGGLDSEISEETTTVALEMALFDHTSIRRTSQSYNLRSESSMRFEKGINQSEISLAGEVAAAMIAELAGGKVLQGAVKGSEVQPKNVEVSTTVENVNRFLGTDLTQAQVNDIFKALEFPTQVHDGVTTVSVPPRRWDITIEADLMEEIARIYGYDRLPSTLPEGQTVAGFLTQTQKATRKVRQLLESAGLSEAISYALTTEEKAQQFLVNESKVTRVAWPMSEERSTMRLNLVSGLLEDLSYNVARKNSDVAFYEIGHVFYQNNDPKKDLPSEQNHVAIALTGNIKDKSWTEKAQSADYYTIKGMVEELVEGLGLTNKVTYQAIQLAEMHPGQTAGIYLDEKLIGFVGQVHPAVAASYELKATFVAELDLAAMIAQETSPLVFEAVSKYPAISRDIALLVDETTTNAEIAKVIEGAAGKFLAKLQVFDVYQGANIETGKKSMAYNLTFVNPEATLTDEEINRNMSKVTKSLTEKLQAVIR
ncbi:phenylalanine--tRNA ligase subunit beta [Enterococcus dongliensis]|uniref:Phenylalanine--tRNA ligase beta subunit n=1 Tax=Enterococcus dongliensis TaxID=2559925 RepID=A0AAP5KNN4_9ENTE|nr:phenylalanine--tRNA ligase subunit beta [Enterococcus dongliensis]MDT2595705.1 phenylalanine--tRNA ligase subunit beta [Enterococcus dongliensis]MDT2633847.1 phenylalanine--tRNA ligase subunit beta [Enterococcus dongliensis]MDT2636318.1 phenylalanine--tRNA ligase subunit beta [Enterococcus dongliensis]MDT2639939.1 phenylalanine--tRNA ligase subunit beta [Enterococcus dongliensis]MDT2641539.1 phenylalanine--tRNA ligase subunit beta [Enterococcus dongliensis]